MVENGLKYHFSFSSLCRISFVMPRELLYENNILGVCSGLNITISVEGEFVYSRNTVVVFRRAYLSFF